MATFEENVEEGVVIAENVQDKVFEFQQQQEGEFPFVIPASCNWYSPSIISCLNGYCALGGKNAVFIMTLQKHPPVFEWDMIVSPKLNIKVTAVAIIGTGGDDIVQSFPEFIAVGLDEGLARIINTKSKSIVKEHRNHKCKIAAISWSQITPKTLLTADVKGNISIWDYNENSIQIWTPVPFQIICLQMSPVKSALFVVGYQNGNIIVGDSNKLEVVVTFKSHIDDVTSLSWCPVSRDGKLCFVSASKDRTVRLWETTCEKSIGVLSPPKHTGGRKKEAMKQNYFHAVLWLNETQIISALQNGDLICWDDNGKSNIIGSGHDRVVFTMINDSLTNQFVTVSMDREIIVWNGSGLRPAFKIPSFGGFVYSVSTSLNNPYTVALGVGDNVIRILSISDSSPGYECLKLWEGIKSKVTVLSLHPTYEGMVGFGTDDGHVGCYSINSKKCDISLSYHKKVVYSLTWAPSYLCEDFTTDKVKINCLYTVGGEGSVLMHKMGSFNNDACDIGKRIKTQNNFEDVPARSDIAWRVDYTYFVLSNADGTIDLFKTTTLKLVCSVNCHKKMVNCMTWHHNYSYNNEGTCYSDWLASGSNEDVLCITDFTVAISNHCNESKEVEVLRPHKQLYGHSARVTRLVWNPHKNAILASSSFDGSVRIWDVEGNKTLATFHGHLGRVYSVVWSYLNGDVIYSGGEDFTLRRWKISELSNGNDTPIQKRKRTKKKKGDYPKDNCVQNKTEDVITQDEVVCDNSKDSCVQNMDLIKRVNAHSQGVDSNFTVHPDVAQKEHIALSPEITVNVVPREHNKSEGGRKKKLRSLLKKASAADGKTKEFMQEDCISLAKYLKAHGEDEATCKEKSGVDPTCEENINLSLYTTRQDAYSLLSTECRAHEENESYDQLLYLEMWRNNIGGLLDEAIERSSINDTLVALAPLGGYDMWKAALLAYAEQLEGQKKSHMSAAYYLAAGEVYKAINVLKETGYLREAIVMAKVQLGCDDPIIKELYRIRAKKLATECQFEQAAKCFLAAGCIEDSITVLAKRGDSTSLLTSLKVADIYNSEKHSSYLFHQTCSALLREQRWRILHELLPRYSNIELIHFQVVVGELLADHMFETDLVKCNHFSVENHKNYKHFTDQQQMFPSYIKRIEVSSSSSTPSFLMSLLHILEEFCNFTNDTCIDFKHIDFQQLQSGRPRAENLNVTEVWNELVNSILYGVVYLVQGDCVNCFKKWLSVFDILEHCGYPSSVLSLFDVLFPHHYVSFNEIIELFYGGECAQSRSYIEQAFSNFMAFKCSGILYHVMYKVSSNTLLKGSDANVMNSGESQPTNVMNSGENQLPNVMDSGENQLKSSPCNDSSQDTTVSPYDFYCVEEDFYSCLSWLSSMLLSGTHTSYVSLQTELRCVEERLLELDIKKRLNEHILSRKQDSVQNPTISCKQTSEEGDEDTASAVNQVCEHMVNVVIKIETTSGAGHRAMPGALQGHLENEMLAGYLRGKKHQLLETLNSFPFYIKEYVFPQTTVSFHVLLLLCLTMRNERSDDRVSNLCDNIAQWGKYHEIHVTPYIERLMIQK